MDEVEVEEAAEPREGAGASRRNVLLGATGLAAATAVVSAFGGGVAHAAPSAGQMSCLIPGVGEFILESLQWGIGVGVSQQGQTSAPSLSEIVVTKSMDASSPALVRAITRGTPFAEVTITSVGKSGTPVISYLLETVLLSGYSTSSGPTPPFSESISLHYRRITYSFNGESVDYDLDRQI